MDRTIKVNFAKHQQLPPGYSIEFWECDEHYHISIESDPNFESAAYSSKWRARRDCLKLIKSIDENNKNAEQ